MTVKRNGWNMMYSGKDEYMYVVKFDRLVEDEITVFATSKKEAIERAKDELGPNEGRNFRTMKTGARRQNEKL